jgi:spermidine/putrescine-binding protein
MTLAWNKEALPGGLRRWSDLFAESLKGKIMLYNAHYMSLYTFAVAKVELDGKPGTAKAELERNLDGVLEFAKDKSAWVRYWWPTSGDAANALLQKNVVAGNVHGSAVIGPIRDGKPLDFTVPAADRVMAPSFLVVPANTKKADVALAVIDFYARPDIQQAIVEESGGLQGCNIPSIAAELAPKYPEWAKVFASTPASFETLDSYPFELYERHLEKIKTFWERQVLRKT